MMCAFLLLACSCGHHTAIINEDLGHGYVLQAIDVPEQLELSHESKVIVDAPVLGYFHDDNRIIIYKKTTKTVIRKQDGSTTESPYTLDLDNRPATTDDGQKITWYYY